MRHLLFAYQGAQIAVIGTLVTANGKIGLDGSPRTQRTNLPLMGIRAANAKQVCVDASVGRDLCEYAKTIMEGRNKSGGSLVDFFAAACSVLSQKIT